MGPAAYQPTRLIIEMCEFNLQPPFGRRRAFAKDFKDQARPVDGFKAGFILQIALLDGGQTGIDNQQVNFQIAPHFGDLFNLPSAKQRYRAWAADTIMLGTNNIQTNGKRKPGGLGKSRIRADRSLSRKFGIDDKCTGAASELVVFATVEYAQISASSTPWLYSARFTGCAG